MRLFIGLFFAPVFLFLGCARPSAEPAAKAVTPAPVSAADAKAPSDPAGLALDLLDDLVVAAENKVGFELSPEEDLAPKRREGAGPIAQPELVATIENRVEVAQEAQRMFALNRRCADFAAFAFPAERSELRARVIGRCQILEISIERKLAVFHPLAHAPGQISYGGPESCRGGKGPPAAFPTWLPYFLRASLGAFQVTEGPRAAREASLAQGILFADLCAELGAVDPQNLCGQADAQAVAACQNLRQELLSWGVQVKEKR